MTANYRNRHLLTMLTWQYDQKILCTPPIFNAVTFFKALVSQFVLNGINLPGSINVVYIHFLHYKLDYTFGFGFWFSNRVSPYWRECRTFSSHRGRMGFWDFSIQMKHILPEVISTGKTFIQQKKTTLRGHYLTNYLKNAWGGKAAESRPKTINLHCMCCGRMALFSYLRAVRTVYLD